MKKLSAVLVLAAILTGSACLAIQAINVDEQKAVNQTTNAQYREFVKNDTSEVSLQLQELGKRYSNNFRNCEPVHIYQSIDLFGLKFSIRGDINGWVDNKCSYEMSFKVSGVGKDINEIYGLNIKDEDISKIEPKVTCNFSQEELNILVDAVAASMKRVDDVKTLEVSDKSAANSAKTQLSPEEKKAFGMLIGSGACTTPDMSAIMTQYSELVKPKQ